VRVRLRRALSFFQMSSRKQRHLFSIETNLHIERTKEIFHGKGKRCGLRSNLIELIKGGNAHVELNKALEDFPAELREKRPDGSPYSPWELLEHNAHCAVGHPRILAEFEA